MSSNLCYNKSKLQLHVPQVTSQFPLSSPIGDDQLSNQSFESKRTATSSDLVDSPHSSQNPFGDTESGNTSGQDEFHLERYSEPSTSAKNGATKQYQQETRTGLQQQRDVLPGKKKKPGLNLVTDFSKPKKRIGVENPTMNEVHVRRPRLEKENSHSTTGSRTSIREMGLEGKSGTPGFVNLSDLQGLRRNKKSMGRQNAKKGIKKYGPNPNMASHPTRAEERDRHDPDHEMASEPTLGKLFRHKSFKASKESRNRAPHYLRAPEQEIRDVSPTARSVVIGISIPENEVEAHKPSDEASSALTLHTPITPTILVTPADATVGWSHSAIQGSVRRPASSLYSQVTGVVYKQDADAPPMPSLRNLHKRCPVLEPEQTRDSICTWKASPSTTNRPFSSDTIIDEDDAQQAETTPLSAGSKDDILPSTCETGRPRSKGWWNLMLSPMLSRAGTNATKKTSSPVEEAPALPSLRTTTEKGSISNEPTSTIDISPETPRRAGLETSRNSTWSNWTQWERDRAQALASLQISEGADDPNLDTAQETESVPRDLGVVDASAKKLGLAAEYYQACAFDLLNPVPYFECVNHDCVNALPKLGDFSKGLISSQATDVALDPQSRTLTEKGSIGSATQREDSRLRSGSDSTIIEDDPVELSPNVRKADARPILKASQPQKIDSSPNNDLDEKDKSQVLVAVEAEADAPASKPATPPPYSPPPAKPNIPRYVGIMPPSRQVVPSSPGPLSPQAQTAMNPNGGIPMSQIHQPASTFINFNSTYPADLPPRPAVACVSLSDIENPVEVRKKAEARRQRLEQEDSMAYKAGGLWRGRACFPKNGCFGRGGPTNRARRRWCVVIATSLLLMIILIVVLATQLTRRGDQTPVQSQWLNLTGYPPMPTGISTIGQPDIASTVTTCVQPSSLWSCALPREDQARNSPNDSDQPNFRLEIRFRNGTVNTNGTIPVSKTNEKRARGSRRMVVLRRQNDPFTNSLFEPSPAPPGLAEQTFLGNTTDNTTFPFSGEATPFFLTLLTSDPSLPETLNDTTQPSRRHLRRQTRSGSGSIPAPAVLPNGTAAPANLLPSNPMPVSQPVMLYNRGLDTEHYGFYTYFDKSIFIKTTTQFNSSSSSAESGYRDDPFNSNGGSSRQDADLRCTWAQTRFLVQIWTNAKFNGQILPMRNGTRKSSGPVNDSQEGRLKSGKSSATDFDRPGSFPYPVTVTLDRHGGDSSKKGVYCYGMDGQQKILVSERKLVAELRGAGGTLINAAPGIFSKAAGSDDGFDRNAGGVDGGTGGCGCEWKNWAGGRG